MKDMNRAYGFTDDLPESDDDLPPTAESLRQITQNLKSVDMSSEQNQELLGRFLEFFSDGAFTDELSKVRGQLSDLQANSGRLMENL